MSTTELKSNLHKLIDKVQDSQTLKITYLLLSKKSEESEDWWDTISDEEREGIEEGLKDFEEGRVFSHEEVMKELKAQFPNAFR